MLIGTQEMQGAYELAKRVKLNLKDRAKAKSAFAYNLESIIVDYVIDLIDLKLEKMELENQKQMTEESANVSK